MDLGRILSLNWHSSGDVIATGGVDTIRLWSVEPGHAVLRISLPRHAPDKPTIVWAVTILQV